jgi:hypothetical protein
LKRIACGLIAGLSVGARPHITLLIVLYWCFRAHRPFEVRHVLTAVLAFAVGIAAWLIPATFATGGPQIYWTATVANSNGGLAGLACRCSARRSLATICSRGFSR